MGGSMNEIKAHERLAAASDDVRQFAGCDASRCFAALLESLAECYRFDLENATPETLGATQAKLRQVRALLSVVAGDTNASAKT